MTTKTNTEDDYTPPKLTKKEEATELDRFMVKLDDLVETARPQDPKKGK